MLNLKTSWRDTHTHTRLIQETMVRIIRLIFASWWPFLFLDHKLICKQNC